jgi:hypothetical protein
MQPQPDMCLVSQSQWQSLELESLLVSHLQCAVGYDCGTPPTPFSQQVYLIHLNGGSGPSTVASGHKDTTSHNPLSSGSLPQPASWSGVCS